MRASGEKRHSLRTGILAALFLLGLISAPLDDRCVAAARPAPTGAGGYPITPMHAAAWFGEQAGPSGKTLALIVYFEGTPGWHDQLTSFTWELKADPARIDMKVGVVPIQIEYWATTSTIQLLAKKFNVDATNVFLVRNIDGPSPSVMPVGRHDLRFASPDNPALVLLRRAAAVRSALTGERDEGRTQRRPQAGVPAEVIALDARGLELMYENNREDDRQACELFRQAAERGYAESQYRLGYCYESGRGVTQDPGRANEWYLKAAGQGYVHAQYKLGHSFRVGRGAPVDLAKALHWYARAAEQGDAEAQYNLALFYATGQGTAPDLQNALLWYRKAADQDMAAAQYEMAARYRDGNGVQSDLVESYKWLLILRSHRRNLPAADWQAVASATQGMEARITHEQKGRAQVLAREWQRGYTKRYLKSLAEK